MALHDEHRLTSAGPLSAQVSDARIAGGRQPPVELQFALKSPFTPLLSAEIQEVGANRFF